MYLKNLHRHLFYIRVIKDVSHNDRDIEIIKFKKSIIDYLNYRWYDDNYKCLMFDNMSCENIAEDLYKKFKASLVAIRYIQVKSVLFSLKFSMFKCTLIKVF